METSVQLPRFPQSLLVATNALSSRNVEGTSLPSRTSIHRTRGVLPLFRARLLAPLYLRIILSNMSNSELVTELIALVIQDVPPGVQQFAALP